MIGLEYIRTLNGKSLTDVAKYLGVAKQNVYQWETRARKITPKYLPMLSQLFDLPEEYFQKELADVDKLRIQSLKLKKEIDTTMDRDVIEKKIYNSTDKTWITLETHNHPQDSISTNYYIENQIKAIEVLDQIKADIFDSETDYIADYIDYEDFIAGVLAAIKQYESFLMIRNGSYISQRTLQQILDCLISIPKAENIIPDITEKEVNEFDFEKELSALLLRKKAIDDFRRRQWKTKNNPFKKGGRKLS